MNKKDIKLINEIYYGDVNKMYTVVTGGVDNTSEEGFNIMQLSHIQAALTDDAFSIALKKIADQNPSPSRFEYGVPHQDVFPELFTGDKWTLRTNDNGEFICAIEGQFNSEQCFHIINKIWNNL